MAVQTQCPPVCGSDKCPPQPYLEVLLYPGVVQLGVLVGGGNVGVPVLRLVVLEVVHDMGIHSQHHVERSLVLHLQPQLHAGPRLCQC
jgi:hypothetical protein